MSGDMTDHIDHAAGRELEPLTEEELALVRGQIGLTFGEPCFWERKASRFVATIDALRGKMERLKRARRWAQNQLASAQYAEKVNLHMGEVNALNFEEVRHQRERAVTAEARVKELEAKLARLESEPLLEEIATALASFGHPGTDHALWEPEAAAVLAVIRKVLEGK